MHAHVSNGEGRGVWEARAPVGVNFLIAIFGVGARGGGAGLVGEEPGVETALEGGEPSGELMGLEGNEAGSSSLFAAPASAPAAHRRARNNSASSETNHSMSGWASSSLPPARGHPFLEPKPSCLGCSVPALAPSPLRVRACARVAGEIWWTSGSADAG